MKRIFTIFSLFVACLTANATNYPGNTKTGFGGPVGTGSLDITNTGTLVTFTLNKGSGSLNDVVVVYLDVTTGGFTTTAGFADVSSGLLKAVSGFDGGTNRATYNFNNFAPEYAIAFMPNGSAGAVAVALGNAAHVVLGTPVLTNNGSATAATYSTTIDAAAFGVTGGVVSFNFLASYISNTGYRADEAVGDAMTGFNQGWNAYTSTTNPLTYITNLPVTLSSFTGSVVNKTTRLNWETKSEANFKNFEVQKSIAGSEWTVIGSVAARNAAAGAPYGFSDNNMLTRTAWYRLKMIDRDGSYKFSGIVMVKEAGARGTVAVLGNPVANQIRMNISNAARATYSFDLLTAEGRKINTMTYKHAGGESTVTMPLFAAQKGFYFIRVNDGLQLQSFPVLVN